MRASVSPYRADPTASPCCSSPPRRAPDRSKRPLSIISFVPEAVRRRRRYRACASGLEVPHRTLSAKWAEKPLTAIQERARAERYRLLGEWAEARGLAALATAHHLDDQAETLLMRLARGAGVRGLAAMRPIARVPGSDLPLLRPLLGWRRSELAAICCRGWRGSGQPTRAMRMKNLSASASGARSRKRTGSTRRPWHRAPQSSARPTLRWNGLPGRSGRGPSRMAGARSSISRPMLRRTSGAVSWLKRFLVLRTRATARRSGARRLISSCPS